MTPAQIEKRLDQIEGKLSSLSPPSAEEMAEAVADGQDAAKVRAEAAAVTKEIEALALERDGLRINLRQARIEAAQPALLKAEGAYQDATDTLSEAAARALDAMAEIEAALRDATDAQMAAFRAAGTLRSMAKDPDLSVPEYRFPVSRQAGSDLFDRLSHARNKARALADGQSPMQAVADFPAQATKSRAA